MPTRRCTGRTTDPAPACDGRSVSCGLPRSDARGTADGEAWGQMYGRTRWPSPCWHLGWPGRSHRTSGHDRRSGERVEIVSVDSRQLDRRAADELYGIALSAGIDADVTLVTGCRSDDVIDPDLYRRLCSDLRANGKVVIADLTGPPLRATVEGGVELLRLSEEELVCDHHAASDAPADIVAGARP